MIIYFGSFLPTEDQFFTSFHLLKLKSYLRMQDSDKLEKETIITVKNSSIQVIRLGNSKLID